MKTLAACLFALVLPASGQLRIEEEDANLRVFDGEKLVAAYRTDYRVPYLYPLLSPSGANITRHWPMNEEHEKEERDHPHHRSLWMAHGAVNDVDFWHGKDARIKHLGFENVGVGDDGTASFTANLEWTADDKSHLTEKRVHRFRKSGDNTLVLDFTSTVEAADGDALFGDTKEGMFAIRMDRTLRQKGPLAKSKLLNSEGIEDGKIWGKRASWVATIGPDELGKPAVVALFDHPDSFRHPTWWHARDYGLIAANPFGIHDFEGKEDATLGNHLLKKGDKLTFRYAVVIHHGDLESANLKDLWQDFSQKP